MRRFSRLSGCVGLVMIVATAGAPEAQAEQFQPAIVSEFPAQFTPHVLDADGRVDALAKVGNEIIVGGKFTQIAQVKDGTPISRSNIFAFDATTGLISPTFAPTFNNRILSLTPAPDGQSVFVSGAFTMVNGVTRRRVVELDVATGAVITAFKANADDWIWDMKVSGGRLYLAGAFTTIGGVTRQGLAAVDPVTGGLLPDVNFTFTQVRTGTPRVQKIAISPDGTKLVAIGNFTLVSGVDRKQIAMFDLTSSPVTLSNWETQVFPQVDAFGTSWCSSTYDTYMRGVDFSPDGSYFAVVGTGAFRANRMCDTASRWETNATGTGLQPTWVDWTGGDSATGVAVTGTAIYVGGHQRWENNPYRGDQAGPGAVSREGLAALDPVNGLPFSWNPTRDRGRGVFAILATDQGIFMGSDTDRWHLQYHAKLAYFPLAGGVTVPPNNPYALPNDLYNLESVGGNMVRRPYDGSTFGSRTAVPSGIDWTQARGVFALNGVLYMGWSDGWLYSRTFDGTNVGPATQLNLYGLDARPPSGFNIPGTNTRVPALTDQLKNGTGMFFDNGRIYYTVRNDTRLYYRYFTPQSQVVGANLFVASSSGAVDWRNVRGMTLANGNLYYALTDGTLNRIPFINGAPSGSPTVIGGPLVDGYNWASQGLFAFTQTADTLPPTTPGKPTAVSNTTDSIDLTWAASHDNFASSITYRIYRDGNSTPIGTVTSNSTTTVSFTDLGLTAGSTHTYTVDAQDAVPNTSAMSPISDAITVQVPDTTPPTMPGQPSGLANGKNKIDLAWAASTDNESTNITYRIYRDGNSTPVGAVTSNSTTTVSFTDTGLDPGSTHTYTVDAQDAVPNTSAMSPVSDPITTVGNIFTDSFGTGDLSAWTNVTRLTIDPVNGAMAPPSAVGSVTGQGAFAHKVLPSTYSSMCMSEAVNVTTQDGNSVVLLRLLTSSGGGVVKVFLSSTGVLFVKSDVANTQKSSLTILPAGWNMIELCGTVSSAGTWDLYLNGSKIVNAWTADTGTTPVGRVQVGDDTSKTWTINFDDVVIDQIPS